jgi:hypothetical protein
LYPAHATFSIGVARPWQKPARITDSGLLLAAWRFFLARRIRSCGDLGLITQQTGGGAKRKRRATPATDRNGNGAHRHDASPGQACHTVGVIAPRHNKPLPPVFAHESFCCELNGTEQLLKVDPGVTLV